MLNLLPHVALVHLWRSQKAQWPGADRCTHIRSCPCLRQNLDPGHSLCLWARGPCRSPFPARPPPIGTIGRTFWNFIYYFQEKDDFMGTSVS